MTDRYFRNIKGYDALARALAEVPVKMEAKFMRGAMRAGAVVMQRDIRSSAPVGVTGEYKKGIRVATSLKNGQIVAVVRTTGRHGYLANWLEHGTAAHEIVPRPRGKKEALLLSGEFGGTSGAGAFFAGVMHPGTKPRPHFRPALDNRAEDALRAVGAYLQKRLTKQGFTGLSMEADE